MTRLVNLRAQLMMRIAMGANVLNFHLHALSSYVYPGLIESVLRVLIEHRFDLRVMNSQLTFYYGQPHWNLHLVRSNRPLTSPYGQKFRNLLQNISENSFLQTRRKWFISWISVDFHQNTDNCYNGALLRTESKAIQFQSSRSVDLWLILN